ncbi:MAG: hypothetical protein JW900_07225 [Anaerolineae bacterium]|nr:hypothetical protein [Anaerolineae bacterium]
MKKCSAPDCIWWNPVEGSCFQYQEMGRDVPWDQSCLLYEPYQADEKLPVYEGHEEQDDAAGLLVGPRVAYRDPAGKDHLVAPLAQAFDPHGHVIRVAPDRTPAKCDHAGAVYSCQLDMGCPRCGARMFLPPRFLANLEADVIEAMHNCWGDAGWPWYSGGRWTTVGGIQPDGTATWTVLPHPLFAMVGGIPVRHDKVLDWTSKWGGLSAREKVLTYIVEGDCQEPRVCDGDIIMADVVGLPAYQVQDDLAPGELVIHTVSGYGYDVMRLVSYSPGDDLPGMLIGRRVRHAPPGTEAHDTVHAGLDLWFRQDVARILASKAQAASRYTGAEYREGYMDALADVALAFGLVAHGNGGGTCIEGELRRIADRAERGY